MKIDFVKTLTATGPYKPGTIYFESSTNLIKVATATNQYTVYGGVRSADWDEEEQTLDIVNQGGEEFIIDFNQFAKQADLEDDEYVISTALNELYDRLDSISVPTRVSELENDEGFTSAAYLITNQSVAQEPNAYEKLGDGNWIYLHKVAKTGTYSDLIGTPTIENFYFVQGSSSQAGNATSGQYLSTKWEGTVPGVSAAYNGLKIAYRVATNTGVSTAGVVLSIDGSNYYPVVIQKNTLVTTHYPVGSTFLAVFNSTQTATAYLTSNTKSTVTGCWQIMEYDSNSDTKQREYISSDNTEYPITTRYATTSGSSYYAEYGRYSEGVTLNPSTNTITASGFKVTGGTSSQFLKADGTTDSNTYALSSAIPSVASYFDDAVYDSQSKRINFKHGNSVLKYIDATDFIKDGMVNDVSIHNGTGANAGVSCLVVSFNTDASTEDIEIPLSSIFNPSNYYTKTQVDSSFMTIADYEQDEEVIAASLNDLNSRIVALDASIPSSLDDIADGSTRKLSDYLSLAGGTMNYDANIEFIYDDNGNIYDTNIGSVYQNGNNYGLYIGASLYSGATTLHTMYGNGVISYTDPNGYTTEYFFPASSTGNHTRNIATTDDIPTDASIAAMGYTKNALTGVSFNGVDASVDSSGVASITATIPTQTTDASVSGWGYIKSYTETDPIFSASAAAGITSSDITSWNNKVSNVQADWNATTGLAAILNKPAIPSTLDQISDGSTRKLSNFVPFSGGAMNSGASLTFSDDSDYPLYQNIITAESIHMVDDEDSYELQLSSSSPGLKVGTVGLYTFTSFVYGGIVFRPANPGTTYNLQFPAKDGTFALTSDIPAAVTESTVSGWGFTKNTGTLTSHADHKLLIGSASATAASGNTITYVESLTGTATATHGDLTVTPTLKTITIPSEVTESTVSGWGFTKNTGTLTAHATHKLTATNNNATSTSGTITFVESLTGTNTATSGDLTITATRKSVTIPSAPGTLKTNNTSAQTASASESLSGTINLHKVAKTGTYSDLIGTPTIPTVNNATLTIQKNGTNVNTFTANSSSNVTANIQVNELPTVTASDNGKILRVVSGAWSLVNPNVIYSGSGTPSNSIGNDGDIYLQS